MAPKRKLSAQRKPAVKTQRRPEAIHDLTAPPRPPSSRPVSPLIVAVIGASAGGVQAIEQFFDHMPADSQMAFLIVMHRSIDEPTLLGQVVRSHTRMPVADAGNGIAIKPGHVYIAPPRHYLAVRKSRLYLVDMERRAGITLPIDYCFRSVAEDLRAHAVGILLSGMGSDGTVGLRKIKAEGGLVIVQDPGSAQFGGMPESAIGACLQDYVLTPQQMPAQLLRYATTPLLRTVPSPPRREADASREDAWNKILLLLRDQTERDFSHYKPSALRRRIERRMSIHHLHELKVYYRLLEEDPAELVTLANELLIGVTSFFRDPDAWKVFAKAAHPLLSSRATGESVRVWVLACSTGEEAYSMAMCLHDSMDALKKRWAIKLFATDVDERAIQIARAGRYPDGIAGDVGADSLSKYFTKEDSHFLVRADLRGMMTFAVHDILKHPPFSQLDILCCRNLLIYLEPHTQQQLLQLFHHALRPNGLLFLGSSETASAGQDLFTAVDQRWKVFRRASGHVHVPATVPLEIPKSHLGPIQGRERGDGTRRQKGDDLTEEIQQGLLQQHVPPTVITNAQGEIVYIHGKTGAYLEPPQGQPVLHPHLFSMAREGLKLEVMAAIRQAAHQEEPVVRTGLTVKTNGLRRQVDVTVRQMREPDPSRGLMMVTFTSKRMGALPSASEEPTRPSKGQKGKKGREEDRRERHLDTIKEQLHQALQDLGATKEELTAANEEWASAVEELQSTNEELEATREELQSLNEELTTVNAELHSKIADLSDSTNDMLNLLHSQDIACLFLDTHLRIKRFTPQMQELIRLTKGDIGRPVSDLTMQLSYHRLVEDAQEVLRTLAKKEVDMTAQNGRWYSLRVTPYRRDETRIDGVVFTFVDITTLKAVEAQVKAARTLNDAIVATVREPLLLIDSDLRVVVANTVFCTFFHVGSQEVVRRLVYELGNGQWASPDLRRLLEEILPKNTVLEDFAVEHTFPVIGRKKMLLNARRLRQEGSPHQELILLAMTEDHA
ncbi:MAG: PAS domain-containing protein [Nitrospirota bacterium]|nr:PAS domain-containing protein [Nitrospirota bacterium]